MKIKLPLLIILLFLFLLGFAQREENKPTTATGEEAKESNSADSENSGRNELKINLFAPIYSSVELTYERILEDNSGIGLSASYCFNTNSSKGISFETLWSVIPHYRLYFGKKIASGLFIEANAIAAKTWYDDRIPFTELSGIWNNQGREQEAFAYGLGLAVGAKFLSVNGITGDVFLGAGRYFNSKDQMPSMYYRMGVMLGKRF